MKDLRWVASQSDYTGEWYVIPYLVDPELWSGRKYPPTMSGLGCRTNRAEAQRIARCLNEGVDPGPLGAPAIQELEATVADLCHDAPPCFEWKVRR